MLVHLAALLLAATPAPATPTPRPAQPAPSARPPAPTAAPASTPAAVPAPPGTPAERGAALAAAGRASEARPLLEQAFQENPDDPTVSYNLGVVRSMMGANREAIEALENYLLLSPAAENAGDVRGQIAALKAKLNPIPAAAKDAVRRGTELVAEGKADEAEAAFLEGIRLAPQWAAPHFNLGLLHERQGKPAAALDAYRRFLALGAGSQTAAVEARIARLAPLVAEEQARRRGAENEAVANWVRAHLVGRIMYERQIDTVQIADCKLTIQSGKWINSFYSTAIAVAPLRAVSLERSTPKDCDDSQGVVLQFDAPIELTTTYRENKTERQVSELHLCNLPGWKRKEIDPRFTSAMNILATGCGAVPLPFKTAGAVPPTKK